MKYRMPDPAKIGGYNKIEVPPIVIEVEAKENPIRISEKIIQGVIELSPWHKWPSTAPKKNSLLPERINRLARNLIKNRIICLEPACLVLTMKNGRIRFNVTRWLDHNEDSEDPRPLKDIQHLEQLMEDIARDVAREKEREQKEKEREEATPEEMRQIIDQLVRGT